MKRLLLALPLLLTVSACGETPAEQQPVEGPVLRGKINQRTADYGGCVLGAIKSIEIRERLASTLADEAFKNCRGSRDALTADVLAFRRLGHPSEQQSYSKVSAEQSVINLDAGLREQVLVIATQRRLAGETGKNAAH